jgi:hypothetical protein
MNLVTSKVGAKHEPLVNKLASETRLLNKLYYKHTAVVNYTSSIVNKLEALLTDDTRVVIYYRHVFIVHVTSLP